MMNEKRYSQGKIPIYPADIEKCRQNLLIGQQVRIRIPEWDVDFRSRVMCRQCTVEEKHRWLFVARDRRGKRYAVTYVELIIQNVM